ncbi:hypothetical protein [Thermomonas sp.]|uniref:hypothetical protein n=1 Tax=Thermomonas sp. TaxID=1971895 RepID=UPI00248799CB|nr:hypothetical protein [Thermomonas sp.]MDI1253847.1 hypothetical protein [Thermomonas sp.]
MAWLLALWPNKSFKPKPNRYALGLGLIPALGVMKHYSAIGYVITAVAIAADLVILGDSFPSLSGTSRLLLGQAILLALFPAALLLFVGARRSTGKLSKVLGYSVSLFDALVGIAACVAIGLIASGQMPTAAA